MSGAAYGLASTWPGLVERLAREVGARFGR